MRRIAVALAGLLALWIVDVVTVANRIQGDRIQLWMGRLSSSALTLLDSQAIRTGKARDGKGYDYSGSPVSEAEGVFSVHIHGFSPVALDERLASTLRSSLHPSLELGLYSLRFGAPLLEMFERDRDPRILRALIHATAHVLDAAERFTFPPDTRAFNDHAVAERTEFLLLLLSRLDELDFTGDFRERLRRHIRHNAALLADDSRFTWKTNHGLMQIRALLDIASAAPQTDVGRHSLSVAVSRIEEMLPYIIAEDGAILEAASGYWVLIYEEWTYLAGALILPEPLRQQIRARLIKTARFLDNVIGCSGFLQGMGDAYSKYIEHRDLPFDRAQKAVFFASNGLAGLEYSAGDVCTQVLFVSLDTPPNIHKMPEDLAVYVFAGEPLFINTGIYGYDNSPERRYVLAPESQSTVGWQSDEKYTSSRLLPPRRESDGTWIMSGEKRGPRGVIHREVRFVPKQGKLMITDRSDTEFRTRFNLHPDVRAEDVNSNELLLRGAKATVRFRHSGERVWNDRWVATANFTQTPIRQLEIRGNPVSVEMYLPPVDGLHGAPIGSAIEYPERLALANQLSNKYSRSTLARTESSSRFVKLRLLMLAPIFLSAALLLSSSTVGAGLALAAVVAIFLAADTVSAGFLTTAIDVYLRGLDGASAPF